MALTESTNQEIKSTACNVLQKIHHDLSLNNDKLDESFRYMNEFLSEKNYGDAMTEEQFREFLSETLVFSFHSMTENKREQFLEKCFSLIYPSTATLEECFCAGFIAGLSVEQKQH